jgi:hypothetical protein
MRSRWALIAYLAVLAILGGALIWGIANSSSC